MPQKWFHHIEMRELASDASIFYDYSPRMHLRERYQPFVCRRCGRFDPREAVRAGFDDKLGLTRVKRDAFTTRDMQRVVSRKLFDYIEKLFPRTFEGHPIGDSPYVWVFPRRLVRDDQKAAGVGSRSVFVIHAKRCRACGRHDETTLNSENFRMPRSAHFAGIWVESRPHGCPNVQMVADDLFVEQVTRRPWSGLQVRKNQYGEGNPFSAKPKIRKTKDKENAWLNLLAENA